MFMRGLVVDLIRGLVHEVAQRVESEIRVHCLSAISRQQAEIMDTAGLASLQHQAHFRAQPFAN